MVSKIPMFVTEIVLFICCPYVFMNYHKLLKLPKVFIFAAGGFFSLGIFHLISGLLSGNLFALRDSVLSIYMVFILISYLVFLKPDNFKNFLKILIIGNMLAMVVFKYFLFLAVYQSIGDINKFISCSNLSDLKGFNFGIYSNIFIAFIFSFCGMLKKNINKILMFLLLSLNIYTVVSMASRSTVIAFIANIIFFLLVLRGRYLKLMIAYFLTSLILVGFSYYVDFNVEKISSYKKHGSRLTSIVTLFKSILTIDRKAQTINIDCAQKLCVGESVDQIENGLKSYPEWARKKTFATEYMKKILKAQDNLKYISQNEAYGNAYWRMVVGVQAVEFGLQAPILGKGFGVYPDYRLANNQKMTELNKEKFALYSQVISPHNHIITVLMKMGFVGLALFLFINIYAFVVGLELMKKCNNVFIRQYVMAVLGSFVSWHVLALLFDVIDAPMTNMFLWIFLGMIFAIRTHIDDNSANKGFQYETKF
ncbi:MAG: O-antigen ligase family protein [Candidatus Omnitrophica bacterium]|nr:O-antigen ligase family protein [Candidatus Omnitrophota bacterium]